MCCCPIGDHDNSDTHPAAVCRETAAKNLAAQAERMVLCSRSRLPVVVTGDNVLIPIPEFDRGRGDPPNLIGAVMDTKEGKYKIGMKHGFVNHLLERNAFEVTKYHSLRMEDITEDLTTSVRNPRLPTVHLHIELHN